MRIGSLFSGIGGIELGLERAGLGPTVWQVENDAYCQRVLAKHWPDATRYGDVREIDWEELRCTCAPDATSGDTTNTAAKAATGPGWVTHRASAPMSSAPGCGVHVDVVCGGFPCQPFSPAGRREGIADERWMWPEVERCLRALRPRWVLLENVPGLLADGDAFGAVLADLAALGFDAEWLVLSACAVGAPHMRRRLFVLAYAGREGGTARWLDGGSGHSAGREHQDGAVSLGGSWWSVEPDVDRMAHGVPARVDRVRALGNAVVPQVAEFVGRRIVEAERAKEAA